MTHAGSTPAKPLSIDGLYKLTRDQLCDIFTDDRMSRTLRDAAMLEWDAKTDRIEGR